MKNQKIRIAYGGAFLCLALTVVFIALFVRDSVIRPYGGDVLVVMVLCCFFRMLWPSRSVVLPLLVFLFSCLVEVFQGLDYVSFLGLDAIPFFRTWMGTTFSVEDLVCYAVGCVLFFLTEGVIFRCLSRKGSEKSTAGQ